MYLIIIHSLFVFWLINDFKNENILIKKSIKKISAHIFINISETVEI